MAWAQARPPYYPGMWPPLTTNVSIGLKVSVGTFPMLVLKNTSSLKEKGSGAKSAWSQLQAVLIGFTVDMSMLKL